MSKGLGKVQRKILNFFADAMMGGDYPELNIINLTRVIYKLRLLERPSRYKYTSICRAVHSLYDMGYVKITTNTITKDSKDNYGIFGRHEPRREKMVSIGDQLKKEINRLEKLLEWYRKS